MKKLTGECLCGAIAYEINGELGAIVNCHCSKCRRWHGAAFRTRATVETKNFKWIKGQEHLSKYLSSEHVTKSFCSICGSCLISTYDDDPDSIGLPIGGLNQDPRNRPMMNIFVGSKAPWFEITDDLPQYEEWPPFDIRDFEKPLAHKDQAEILKEHRQRISEDIDINSEKIFFLIQKIKCLSRVGYLSFIHQYKPDLPSSILAWFFEKAIDLVDGIIQLHKNDLDECSQALIRVLFETYLKYIHFISIMLSSSQEEAALFVVETIVLIREKNALEQDKSMPDHNFTEILGDLKQLKEKHGSNLGKIKKHGFPLDSIENISRKYNKMGEYQIMYRNFSRNVHANDFTEYFRKQGHLEQDDYIEFRNDAAFDFVFRIFLEMMDHMNNCFGLGMTEKLKEIQKEYIKFNQDE